MTAWAVGVDESRRRTHCYPPTTLANKYWRCRFFLAGYRARLDILHGLTGRGRGISGGRLGRLGHGGLWLVAVASCRATLK